MARGRHTLATVADVDLTVSVIGSGAADPRLEASAVRVGRLLAEAGAVVVCGGLDGVMAGVCRGARESAGRTVGILPGVAAEDANPWVDIALPTGMGEARNVLVVRAGRAVIAIGGGFGTLSELALARKLGVPVIGLDTWPIDDDGILRAESPEQAVAQALVAARRGR